MNPCPCPCPISDTVGVTSFDPEKLDVYRTLFITVGQQPIRWGEGRFWNPTDLLNQQARDPLAIFDERLGVGLVKLHLPIEALAWNLYAVANLEGVTPDRPVP